jgi:hypothetical protein
MNLLELKEKARRYERNELYEISHVAVEMKRSRTAYTWDSSYPSFNSYQHPFSGTAPGASREAMP